MNIQICSRLKKVIFCCAWIVVFFGSASCVVAVQVSPLRQVVSIDPGNHAKVFVEIKNDTLKSMVVSLRVTGVKQGEGGGVIFMDNSDFAETWVVPEKKTVKINPGEKVEAQFNVSVPKIAEARLHYLGLVVAPVVEGGSNVSLSPELVSYLLIQVAGVVKENIQVVAWNLPKKVLIGKKSLLVSFTLRNSGSAVLPIGVDSEVDKISGEKVLENKISINNILPGALRTQDFVLNLAEAENLKLGIYNVSTTVRFGYFGAEKLSELRFFYVPRMVFWGGILLGLVVFSGGFIYHRRRREF